MDVFMIRQAARRRNNEWRYLTRLRLDHYTDESCRKKLRLPKPVIQEIVSNLQDDLQPVSNRNNAIPPDTQVLIALRLLASGSFQVNFCTNIFFSYQ